MKQIKKIIVGYASGSGGRAAVASAVALAHRCGAAVRLVHVVEPLGAYQRMSHPFTAPYTLEEIAQKTGARLNAVVAGPEFAGVQAEYEVRSGKPFIELILAARGWQADLIVVGRASAAGAYPGSTSERIVRKSPTRVIVANKPLSPQAKIFLVPTDFSFCARTAAEEALLVAENFSARVVFFHVFDLYLSHTVAYAQELGVSVPIPPPSPQEMEPEWEAFLSGLALHNVEWQKSSGEGQAADAIVQQAENIKADMIVMGTHGRSGLPHMLLGSVAEKVMRAASCSVLTLRPEPFRFELP